MNNAFFTDKFETKRLVKTGNKSSWSVFSSGFGHFRPMSEEASALNEIQAGKGFDLSVDNKVDITPTDKVIIEGTQYDVKGVKTLKFQGIEYKKVSLTLGLE